MNLKFQIMDNCIFCKIVTREIPAEILFEDSATIAFLDIKGVNPGHVLVIPKEHYADFASTPTDVLCKVIATAKMLVPAILAATGASAFNVGVNSGHDAGQVVGHMHLHLMPRLAGDGLELWHGKPYAEGEMAKAAEAIRSRI